MVGFGIQGFTVKMLLASGKHGDLDVETQANQHLT